jgi:hypothetical protein
MELTRQVVRQTSSRAAFQEFSMLQNALPQATMTKEGFSKISDQLGGLNDYVIGQQGMAQRWRASHGNTLDGFETDWNSHVSPAVFTLDRLSPGDFQATVANLQQTPAGRAFLTKTVQQMGWARANNLLQSQTPPQ